MPLETNIVFQLLIHLKGVAAFHGTVLSLPKFRKVIHFLQRIYPPFRLTQYLPGNVCGKYTDSRHAFTFLPVLLNQHGHGVNFFPCCAAGAPYIADSHVPALKQFRQYLVVQYRKMSRFPHKICIVGSQSVHHLAGHLTGPVTSHLFHILGEGGQPSFFQLPGHPALYQHLFFLQVNAVIIPNICHYPAEFPVIQSYHIFSPIFPALARSSPEVHPQLRRPVPR